MSLWCDCDMSMCEYEWMYDVICVICELTYYIGIGIVMYDKLCLK